MTLRIRLVDDSSCSDSARVLGSGALAAAQDAAALLRFAIETEDPEEIEALRHARRAMLREEWTRGRDVETPSLEDAVFSPGDILWRIRGSQRDLCLEKVSELTERTNRTLLQLQRA